MPTTSRAAPARSQLTNTIHDSVSTQRNLNIKLPGQGMARCPNLVRETTPGKVILHTATCALRGSHGSRVVAPFTREAGR